jgi:adenine deaminase
MGKATNEAVINRDLSQTIDLSVRKREGRAVNAVAAFLRSQLRVPNVYIDPSGPSLSRVDVLAADAAGSGDIHAVDVKILTRPTGTLEMRLHVELVKNLPAHYKYLAIPRNITNVAADLHLFSPDGIGRVGILLILESADQLPTVEMAVKPERFRVGANELTQVERFITTAKPDMYVRL